VGNNGGVLLLIVAIVVISAVVGAIAQFLNKLNEANAPAPRRPNARGARQNDKDMDRFLAEIDRLRKKNSDSSESAAKPQPIKAKPVSRSNSRGDRSRPKVVAERVEPQQRRRVDSGLMSAPPAPVAPGTLSPDGQSRPEQLPVATIVGPTSATGAPATRVTRLPMRERPTPKTNLAMNLTGLLNSGQGVAMAIILQEVLGPPKCKK
jgi:hypothetical protein